MKYPLFGSSMQPILEQEKPSLRTVVNFLIVNVSALNCVYTYVREFNFVSRISIGKVGKG